MMRPTTIAAADASASLGANSLLAVGLASFFVVFAVLLFFVTKPSGRQSQMLNARLTGISRPEPKSLVERLTSIGDRLVGGGDRQRALSRALDVAGIPLRTGEFVVAAGVGGAVLFLLLLVMMAFLPSLLLAIVCTPLLARWYVRRRISKRRTAFVDQLPDVLQTMVSSLRGGYGLPQALDVVANQAQEPAASEFKRVQFEARIGRDPSDALQSVADRMESTDFSWVVSAMQINREVGGELALVLENVADTIRDRQKLRRQVNVLTAEGRLSAYVITAMPIVVAGILLLTNRDYFEPFSDAPGPFLLVMALALLGAGWAWIRRLVKAEV